MKIRFKWGDTLLVDKTQGYEEINSFSIVRDLSDSKSYFFCLSILPLKPGLVCDLGGNGLKLLIYIIICWSTFIAIYTVSSE